MTARPAMLPPELLASAERYAVYRCFSDHGELLYVGSGNFGKRMAEHAQKVWFTQVRGITVEWFADELDARLAERRAIHVEHPKYNVHHRNTQRLGPRKAGTRTPARDTRPSARRMTADEVAAYAWDHRKGDEVPSINAIMRMVAVSRPKAKDAYDILKLTHWAGAE